MPEQLEIEGGVTVRLQGAPPQGTGHRILFGVRADRDEPVVVKIESITGALERERATLTWLETAAPGVAPRLIAFGQASLGKDRVTCLVTEHMAGSAPTTLPAWERMGWAVAQLAALGHPEQGLPVIGPAGFVRAHRERITELGTRLDPFLDAIPQWAELTGTTLPDSTPVVLTHGDPGPGNYLDTGASGSLIDWEEAHVAPLGLDLARLRFIALLGSGPAGYVGRDHRARSGAVAAGYLSELHDRWKPTDQELRWWLSVAGIQFIHSRWRRGGPAPWEHAAEVLAAALASEP